MALNGAGNPAGSGQSGSGRNGVSRPGWFLAVGFAGLAIAIASIADMFSTRPYDGIVPVPYGREGIDVRMVLPGTPAEKAGIRRDDVITRIGDHAVTDLQAMTDALRAQKPGDVVQVTVEREGKPLTLTVTLGQRGS